MPRSARAARLRRSPRRMRQGRLSSNDRERARFTSPCRRRRTSRPARQVLVPSAKLFAVTFFSAGFFISSLHCLIAAPAYGFAQCPSSKRASVAIGCSTSRPWCGDCCWPGSVRFSVLDTRKAATHAPADLCCGGTVSGVTASSAPYGGSIAGIATRPTESPSNRRGARRFTPRTMENIVPI